MDLAVLAALDLECASHFDEHELPMVDDYGDARPALDWMHAFRIPKLAGVEMEAGGVFAAARKLKVDVAVIRAISDKADPSKADNEWRKQAMRTIISLIEFIDLAKMLEQ